MAEMQLDAKEVPKAPSEAALFYQNYIKTLIDLQSKDDLRQFSWTQDEIDEEEDEQVDKDEGGDREAAKPDDNEDTLEGEGGALVPPKEFWDALFGIRSLERISLSFIEGEHKTWVRVSQVFYFECSRIHH